MREVSERLAAMLTGSRDVSWEVNVSRGDLSRSGLPVMLSGAPSWSSSQQVELTAGVRLGVNDPEGVSWAPTGPGDLLAPFGSEAALVCRIAVGDAVERVQVGRLRIAKVPRVRSDRLYVGGRWVTFGEVIDLDLRDRMDVLHRDKFDAPTAVRFPASAWAELAHLSPFPVVRSGADVALPSALAYEGTRAEAVQAVAARLGGVAAFDSTGNLIVRAPGTEPVLELRLGASGTVTEVGSVMDAEGVYNRVVVRWKRPDGVQVRTVRDATGDLSPERWGRRTYTADQGDYIATVQAAESYATRLLARVSSTRLAELEVQCLLDPRLELDDVATVHHYGQQTRIRATKIAYGDTMMTVTGDVLA